jgi:hypothetical protein
MSSTAVVEMNWLEALVVHGDLRRLSPEQKSEYYILKCKEQNLNPANQPFSYLVLNGKEVLYANKGCAEQLRSIHNVSVRISKAEQVGDLYVVVAEATNGNGRVDSDVGAVNIATLKGESLANAMMKAQTKAKRRVTLSLCGLNMLDETEIESIRSEPVHNEVRALKAIAPLKIAAPETPAEPPKVIAPVLPPNPFHEKSDAYCVPCQAELVYSKAADGYSCPLRNIPHPSGQKHSVFKAALLDAFKAKHPKKDVPPISPEAAASIEWLEKNGDWQPSEEDMRMK